MLRRAGPRVGKSTVANVLLVTQDVPTERALLFLDIAPLLFLDIDVAHFAHRHRRRRLADAPPLFLAMARDRAARCSLPPNIAGGAE